jgi:hypothetical protein
MLLRQALTAEPLQRTLTFFPLPSPPGLQVNWCACRFGRYKVLRRPLPPPRASWVEPSPYPDERPDPRSPFCSPNLARPRLPASARPIGPSYAGLFWAPGPGRPKMGSYDGVGSGLQRKRREVGSMSEVPGFNGHPGNDNELARL